MINDPTNSGNLKMLARTIIVFIVVILLIIVCSVLFGMESYSLVSNSYDRPIASMSYHDHRL